MSGLVLCALAGPAFAANNIDSGSTYDVTSVGAQTNPDFKGGTLKINSSVTNSTNFVVEDDSGNTIDAYGNSATFSGAFTGAGGLTFIDSIGGGSVTLTSSGNAYTGVTTISSGAVLYLTGSGTLKDSASVEVDGTLDVSGEASGTTLADLSGAGTVNLGAQNLTISTGTSTDFTGTINGTGGLVVTSGTQILSGDNTYSGGTTVSGGTLQIGDGGTTGSVPGNITVSGTVAFDRADNISFGNVISGRGGVTQLGTGTLTFTTAEPYSGVTTISGGTVALSSTGSIINSSVVANGTFDISATSGAAITSLSGSGNVALGAENLTLTAANGTFSGVISGTGGVTLNGGTEIFSGASTYTGATVVNAGTLELGASTITANITDNGTFGFNSSANIAMSGVVSGSGGISQLGAGITSISVAQAYTGPTLISAGVLALSGSGSSIASSSGVTDNATLDISALNGASIASLAGTGTVTLGAATLVITNAAGSFSGVISGSGGLTLTGGSQSLTGTNSFTGVTTITGGTLYVSGGSSLSTSAHVVDNATLNISGVANASALNTSSIISLSGSGNVVLGGSILNLTNAADTFSGVISGAGGISISGGKEVLSGGNSYTGVTAISAGTLALSGGGAIWSSSKISDNGTLDVSAASGGSVPLASLSGLGTVFLGANNLNIVAGADTFTGVISGSGGLLVSGGTQVLAGSNSYTGGTTILGGTLQLGSAGATGTILGNVTDDGVLVFAPPGSTVFTGVISGSGQLEQSGVGTTILAAADTYTGGTTIAGGTLQIGNGGTSGSILGNIADKGTLAFGRSDSVSFGSVISGTGGVSVISGTAVLTAVNSYSGATNVASGATLVLSGAGSIASSSTVTDNGTLDVSQSANPLLASLSGNGALTMGSNTLTLSNAAGTFSGAVSGSGGVTLAAGSQTLSGTNTYTGATTVNGGTLNVTGSIASSGGVTVNAGGTLSGTGTVPSVTVADGGTLAPGSSGSGTLTANGGVNFSSNSNFVVNTTSSSAPTLAVNGSAALGGTLSVNASNGGYLLGQKLTVLTATGGISGNFTAAAIPSTSGAVFASTISYDANDVYLKVDLSKLSPLLPATASVNATRMVAGIDAGIAAGSTLPTKIENLGNLTSDALGSDAPQLTGELGADLSQTNTSLFDPFMGAIFEHIREGQVGALPARKGVVAPPDKGWISIFGGSDLVSGDADGDGTHKLRSTATGLAAGADWPTSSRMSLGIAISAGTSNFRLADSLGTGTLDGLQLGVYGTMKWPLGIYGAFAGALSLNDITTTRLVTVSGDDELRGKLKGEMLGGRYEMGLPFSWGTPYLALQDEFSLLPGYSESAVTGTGDFALRYASNDSNQADLEIGLRQSTDFMAGRGWALRLFDQLAFQDDLGTAASAKASFVNLAGSNFTVLGAKPSADTGLLSLGADYESLSGFGWVLRFDSGISSRSQSYAGTGGVKIAW